MSFQSVKCDQNDRFQWRYLIKQFLQAYDDLTDWLPAPRSCRERIRFVVNLSFADQARKKEKKSWVRFFASTPFEEINDVH